MTRSPRQFGRIEHRTRGSNWIQLAYRVLILLAFACGIQPRIAHAQSSILASGSPAKLTNPCTDPSTHAAIKDAFRLMCAKERVPSHSQKAIVIGFLGGFVKRDDVRHPEVVFADYLRWRYPQSVSVEVFGNHEAKQALDLILKTVDTASNGSGVRSQEHNTKVILYGHSWGASQVVECARELERHGIPVALTIQVDSVRKMGQNDSSIPANVAKAVNFYQRRGLTPGRPQISAIDSTRTKMLGNFHMTYEHPEIRCDNYRWLSRSLNKPHHLIENDPRVWDKIMSYIDSELTPQPNVQAAQSWH